MVKVLGHRVIVADNIVVLVLVHVLDGSNITLEEIQEKLLKNVHS